MGPAQPVPIQCWGYSLFIFLILFREPFLTLFVLFVYFIYYFIVSLHYGFPLGVCAYWTLDGTSDWVSLAPLLALPGLCGLA